METASEVKATEQTGSVTEQIREILQQSTDTVGSEDDSQAGGADVPAKDGEGDDSRAGSLDTPESDVSAGVEDDPQVEQEEADGADSEAPVDLEYLAETLSIEKAELYDLDIPVGDGEVATLGQLKDAYKEYGPITEARDKLSRDNDQYQRDVMATRAQLNMMMQVANTPEKQQLVSDMMQAASSHHTQWERTQSEAALEAMPEWSEPTTKANDQKSIVELGAQYGFSEPEMMATHDARTLRLLRDAARDRARLAEMQQPAKRVHAKADKPGSQQTRKLTRRKLAQARERAKSSPHMSDKRAYVKNLISG